MRVSACKKQKKTMPVEIRAATPADIPAILTLAAEAKALLKARDINQWQDDYPQQEVFEQDLRAGAGFAVCHGGQNRDAFEKPL